MEPTPIRQVRTPYNLFPQYVAKTLPLAFDESMSYYECLCALVEIINNNAQATAENQEQVKQLTDFVNNYFTNLDVQDEINNKLDEMAASGELENIISLYIELNTALYFSDVSAMKLADNIKDGMTVATHGFNMIGDGGAATYTIHKASDIEANGMSAIALQNDLVALIVQNGVMVYEQFGAWGDGIHDDTNVLKFLLENNNYICMPNQKTYKTTAVINVTPNRYHDFNGATILADHTGVALSITEEAVDWSYPNGLGIANLNIDCNNLASIGINIGCWMKNFDNITIKNIAGTGINLVQGFENVFNNIRLYSNISNPAAIGWDVQAADNFFDDLHGIDLKIFWNDHGKFNHLGDVHAWILTSQLAVGSKMFNLNNTAIFLIDDLYVDTYNYGIYVVPSVAVSGNRFHIKEYVFLVHPTNFPFASRSERPIAFSYYSPASMQNVAIDYLSIEASDSSHNVILSEDRNAASTNPFPIINQYARITNYVSGLGQFAYNFSPFVVNSDFSDQISVIESNCATSGSITLINLVLKITGTLNGEVMLGTIDPRFVNSTSNTNTYGVLTNQQYSGATEEANVQYLYLSSTGTLTTRFNNLTSTRYLKINLVTKRQ